MVAPDRASTKCTTNSLLLKCDSLAALGERGKSRPKHQRARFDPGSPKLIMYAITGDSESRPGEIGGRD